MDGYNYLCVDFSGHKINYYYVDDGKKLNTMEQARYIKEALNEQGKKGHIIHVLDYHDQPTMDQ